MRILIVATTAVVSLVSGARADDAATGPALIEKVNAQWRKQADEIANARLKARIFFRGGDLQPLSLDDLKAQIRASGVGKSPSSDGMAALVKAVSGNLFAGRQPWADAEYVFEGKKFKEQIGGPGTRTSAFNGTSSIEYSGANKAIQISKPGSSNRATATLSNFRLIPRPLSLEAVAETKDAALHIREEARTVIVDPKSGAVASQTVQTGGAGCSYTEQIGFIDYPDGIIFPAASVMSTFNSDGRLEVCEIRQVVSASFNTDVSDDAFKVPVPAGATVFDLRKDRPATSLKSKPSDDAVGFMDSGQRRPPSPPGRLDPRPARWRLVVIAVCIIVGLAAWSFRRRGE